MKMRKFSTRSEEQNCQFTQQIVVMSKENFRATYKAHFYVEFKAKIKSSQKL